MCGLFAVFDRRRGIDRDSLEAATDALAHRGPDARGTLILETPGAVAGFGHRRLSILDPAARSDQPFHARDAALVFNGEIYNYRELRAGMEASGEAFATSGDTEVLHRMLLRRGAAALPEMAGMWAFAYLDEAAGVLTAGRDRYGKKPLFWWADDTTLCLASEAKAIFTWLKRQPAMRQAWIDSFLAYGSVFPDPEGETFFADVREVPPGCVLTADLAGWTFEQTRWFDMSAYTQDEPADDLEERLRHAVISRLVSDRPVGLLLSGGVDSSLILSILAAEGLQDQVRYFVGVTGYADDAAFAVQCAERAEVAVELLHYDYGPDALDRILTMCRHHEKPFQLTGNSVGMFELYNRVSHSGVPVVLDGTGADEVFGGYWDRYLSFACRDAARADDQAWIDGNRNGLEADPDTAGLFQKASRAKGRPRPATEALRFGGARIAEAIASDPVPGASVGLAGAMIMDASRGRLSEWIWQNDRNAMTFGIENRSPFLDHALAPFIRGGYQRTFGDGFNKILLRRQFDHFLPMPTQWRRQKQGLRWRPGPLIEANPDRVLDLIAASETARRTLDLDAWLAEARTDPAVLAGPLTPRLIVLAGLDLAFG